MKKFILLIIIAAAGSCNHVKDKGRFTVNGQINNAVDQHIYLDQLFVGDKNPEVLDTGKLQAGKFVLTSAAQDVGLFRLRMEKDSNVFIFLNDKAAISFTGDAKNSGLEAQSFRTPANISLQALMQKAGSYQKNIHSLTTTIDSIQKFAANDSLLNVKKVQLQELHTNFKNGIFTFADTCSYPVLAVFALGLVPASATAAEEEKKVIEKLEKKFPRYEMFKLLKKIVK